jgi:hypothetical protein
VLADHEYTVLSLLRKHEFDDNDKCAVRAKYPLERSLSVNEDAIITDPELILKMIEGEQSKQEEKKEEVEEVKT